MVNQAWFPSPDDSIMLLASLACLSAALSSPSPTAPDVVRRGDEVLVLGALHELHTREPDFDYHALRKVIVTFRPDILVLEVRPDELATRAATPGRPEYPALVWPILDQFPGRAVAMEPGGETFKQLSSAAGAAFAEFRRIDPAGAALLAKVGNAVDDVLLAHWTSPGMSQDETTEAVVQAMHDIRSKLIGPAFVEVQGRWDGYMAEQARQTVAANPGKRVLVLASFRNRGLIEAALKEVAPARLLGAKTWLDLVEAANTQPPRRPQP